MDTEAFLKVFDELSHFLCKILPSAYEMPQAAVQWTEELVKYNVPKGKLVRGLTVIQTAREVMGGTLSAEQFHKAAVLGWCIEWLQAFFLVADDIMDESTTRRGQSCWYKLKKVGNIAINDSFLLESHIYIILKHYFKSEPYYGLLLDVFHEVSFQTELGQLLDLTSQPADKSVDLSLFTEERHNLIVKYKTSFYSFYVPIILGFIIGGITDESIFQQAKTVCTRMGVYFQIQDDVLDCYGDPHVIGKVGTDIEDNKCSWLIVQALKRASATQREILERNYGKKDALAVKRVKEIFLELNLKSVFDLLEEEVYLELQGLIATVSLVPKSCFTNLLEKIYKRKK